MADAAKDYTGTETDIEELENTPGLLAEMDKAPPELEATKPETHYVEFDALSNSTGPLDPGLEENRAGEQEDGEEGEEEERNNTYNNTNTNTTTTTTTTTTLNSSSNGTAAPPQLQQQQQQQKYYYTSNNTTAMHKEADYTASAQAALPAVMEQLAEKQNKEDEANYYRENIYNNSNNNNNNNNNVTGSVPSTSNTVNSTLFHPAHDVEEEEEDNNSSAAMMMMESKVETEATNDNGPHDEEHNNNEEKEKEEEEPRYHRRRPHKDHEDVQQQQSPQQQQHEEERVAGEGVTVPALYLTRPSAAESNVHRGSGGGGGSAALTPRHSGGPRHATARTASTPRRPTLASSRRSQSLNSLNSATSQLTGQILHRASIVSAARYFTSRRASSVIHRVGLHDYDNPNRRTNLTEAEVFALEKMAENEARRQSVLERAAELQLARDALVVAQEENYEADLQRRLREREAARERLLRESSAEREERLAAVRARRAAQEAARQTLISHQIHYEEQVIPDPFSVWYTKHRFSTPQLRGQSPIAPGRKGSAESAPQQEPREQHRRRGSPPGRTQTPLRHPQRRMTAPAAVTNATKMNANRATNKEDEQGMMHSAATRQGRSPIRNGRLSSPLRWRSPSVQHERPWR